MANRADMQLLLWCQNIYDCYKYFPKLNERYIINSNKNRPIYKPTSPGTLPAHYHDITIGY